MAIAPLIDAAFDIYLLMVLARVVISWIDVDPYHPVVVFLRQWTDPVLKPIQGLLPPMGGLDFSPIVAIFLIMLVRNFVLRLITG